MVRTWNLRQQRRADSGFGYGNRCFNRRYLNYDFVYVLFDNDKTGIELAEYYQTNYGYEPVYIHNYNDLDEFFINQPEECKKLLKSL